jgi:hypothetical protein
MRERHWRALMAITGKELSLAEDVFKLQHLLECNLLSHRRAGAEGRGRAWLVRQQRGATELLGARPAACV